MGRYDDIDPRDIDPETNRPYAGFSSPALDTSFHDGERDGGDAAWLQWCRHAEKLIGRDLDADEATDCFSLDGAHDAYTAGKSPQQYAVEVGQARTAKGLPGFTGGVEKAARTPQQQAAFDCGYSDEMTGAPSTAAPKNLTNETVFDHYQAGRNAALAEAMDSRADDDDDLEDMIDEAINDSLDVDWTSRDGAKAVLRALEEAGMEIVKKAAVPVEDDDEGYPGPCTDPGGHEFPRDIEEHERCLCIHCGADGDA